MRHHRLPLLPCVVAVGFALVMAGCEASTSVGSYDVTYRANVANVVQTAGGHDSVIGGLPVLFTVATIDSILYSPGTGKCTTTCNADSSLIKLTSPAVSRGISSTELFVPSGATVQATLYGKSVAAGTAKFVVIWMAASGFVRGDSVTTATSSTAGTAFTLSINKRTL